MWNIFYILNICIFLVDGNYTTWSTWTTCTVTCGGGTQTRDRSCTNPAPKNGGNACVGAANENQACNTQNCPSWYFLNFQMHF